MFDIMFIMVSLVLASTQLENKPANKERKIVQTSPGTPCREADGRIRIGCLPDGTVRALPSRGQAVDGPIEKDAMDENRDDCPKSRKPDVGEK